MTSPADTASPLTLHLICHTHWDREWYLTFQQFRRKLVHLIDDLLDLMDSTTGSAAAMQATPALDFFMLDGQTIILEDYLEIRPERRPALQALIQAGRLLIGPWYILPDEFLVSPEALVRNLLRGDRLCQEFEGARMAIGYIPDPFGHIGQMPQILQGFGIPYACVQRGLDEQPCEFWWEAPDGSRVLMAYLRDGYGNAAGLPDPNPEAFSSEINRIAAALQPHSQSGHLLLMCGTDHMPAQPHTAANVQYTNTSGRLMPGAWLQQSTLPAYFAAIQPALGAVRHVVRGELRSSRRFHLLPGVLSTRSWIKQRNHACEVLLERWAEPFSVFSRSPEAPFLQQAWKLLLTCHPHDSICGCSIDPVHEEMRSRFDQVQQLGEDSLQHSLQSLSARLDTRPSISGKEAGTPAAAVLVFNAAQVPQSGLVEALVPDPSGGEQIFQALNPSGEVIPTERLATVRRRVASLNLDRNGLLSLLTSSSDGRVTSQGSANLAIQDIQVTRLSDHIALQVLLSENGAPNPEALTRIAPQMAEILSADPNQDPASNRFHLTASTSSARLRFLAQEVPPFGCRVYHIYAQPKASAQEQPEAVAAPLETAADRSALEIANQFYRLRFDPASATFTLTDLRSGLEFNGLNRFVDGGDCGDEYNYCPPAQDRLVQARTLNCHRLLSAGCQKLQAELELLLPRSLTPDRQGRSLELLPMRIAVSAQLLPASPRLEFQVALHNPAADHRLRVHFPAPFRPDAALYDGHFEIVARPLDLPTYDETWAEEPRPEVPQRNFTALLTSAGGLLLANRGLREVEVIPTSPNSSEIALTLLRCVGWLSRDDFPTRRGHAGPDLPTPGAQMIGDWEFDYALQVIPPDAPWPGDFPLQAAAFSTPLRSLSAELHAGDLPAQLSFLEVQPPEFAITALKPAETGEGWILRGVNLSAQPIVVHLRLPYLPYQSCHRCNLAEQPLEALQPAADGWLRFPAAPAQIVSLRFTPPA